MPNKLTTTATPRGDLMTAFYEAPQPINYLSMEVFPGFSAPSYTGAFGDIPVDAILTVPNDVAREARAGYSRSEWTYKEQTYRCREYGHEELADDGEAAVYNNFFNYEQVLAARGIAMVKLKQELRAMALCHNITTFPLSGTTGLNCAIKWNVPATALPINDINAGLTGIRARSGLKANTLQVSFDGWRDLWATDQVRQALKYVQKVDVPAPTDTTAAASLAATLGLDRVIIADAVTNTAKKGQTPVISDVWANTYAFLFVAPKSNDLSQACFGRCFTFDEDGGEMTVETYRDETKRSLVYRARQVVHEKVLYTPAAFLFQVR